MPINRHSKKSPIRKSPSIRGETYAQINRPHLRLSRDSPDESQTGVNIRAFPAFPQDSREVRTATGASGSPNGGRGADLATFPPSSALRISEKSQTGVNIRAFPAFPQDSREVRTATGASGSPNGGRGADLAIFPGIWTHSSRRALDA